MWVYRYGNTPFVGTHRRQLVMHFCFILPYHKVWYENEYMNLSSSHWVTELNIVLTYKNLLYFDRTNTHEIAIHLSRLQRPSWPLLIKKCPEDRQRQEHEQNSHNALHVSNKLFLKIESVNLLFHSEITFLASYVLVLYHHNQTNFPCKLYWDLYQRYFLNKKSLTCFLF